jgi:hypothetical protein
VQKRSNSAVAPLENVSRGPCWGGGGFTAIPLKPVGLLLDWAREVDPLHAKGFASIGCAPCTRAIRPGEPERAGRWWWEDESKKECGLHIAPGAAR